MRDRQQDVAVALLERDREVERLERSIAAATGGAGSVVVLEGEAGIGKTALLAHARHVGSSVGMRVLGARGGELERDFAYGIVRQLFEAPLEAASTPERERWLAGAAGLAAPIVSASAPGRPSASDPGAVLHGLYWLAANVSIEQPLLFTVDDAHWADDASIAFLSYLSRRVDELPILIVYCSRVGEGASDTLLAVAESAISVTVLRPEALSEDATTQFVAQELGAGASVGFARACHVATSGNPFLLGELLRALHEDAIAPNDANRARVERIAPRAIARAVLARLRRLGAAANTLALAVAVLGKSAELRHAAALAELDADIAAEAADRLAAAAILRDCRPLEFIHPIVRTTIYGELAPGRRAAAHKRAARLLADDGAGDVALAPHLLATEASGDPWVVERLRAAAQAVLEHAPAAACTYLARAHREPARSCDRAAVRLELGTAQLNAGQPAAIDHLREVLDRAPDAATRSQAALALVPALVLSGRAQEAMTISDEIRGSAGPPDEELKLRIEGELALVAQFAPRFAKAALARLAAYEGTLTGATSGERVILTCLAFEAAHGHRSASETAELARLALAHDRLADAHRPGSAALFLAVWALIYAGELHEAERQFDHALKRARKHGWEGEFCGVSGSRCQVLIRQGRLAEAEADALTVLAGDRPHAIARAMLLSCLMHTMVERADPATWQPFLSENGLDGDLAEHVMGGILLYSRGHLRLAAGDARAALADFEQLWQRDELSGQHTPAIPSRAPQALAHLQLGNHDDAQALAADELEAARRWNAPSALAYALRAAALVTGDADRVELLRESVAAAEQSQARYEHALSLHEYGATLRRCGRRREARAPLREALDLADRCGALRLAGRARDELIASGARPRRSALRGIDALTPSERRVTQLAADGLGNREIAQALFVTVRTVEGHLTNAYMKLDISTRNELAAVLAATQA